MTQPGAGSQKPAYVRTGAPMGAGAVIVFIAKQIGLDLSVDQVIVVLPVVMFVYYSLARAMEAYNPKLGYVLGIAKAPAYATESAPAPAEGEHLEAVVVPNVPAGLDDPQAPIEVGPVDEPPKDGVSRDWDGMQHDPEAIAEGNLIGAETPDIDFVEVGGKVKAL